MTPTSHPYPAYKPSGVPWLGDVPGHWEVRRIKTLFRELDERSSDGRGELLSLTRAKGLVPQSEASNRIASVADLSNYKTCYPGVLVMNRMQAWSGMFAVASMDGLVSPDYCVFGAIDPCHVKYFEHLFKTPLLVAQFARKSKGIGSGFNRLYTDDFGSTPIACPPLPEQRAIVRYLDHVDRRIRRYVDAKEKLVALLEEEKQAVVNRAVTRGLDPNVRLKPSGVDWLGDVPEHWEVRRLGHLATKFGSGLTPRGGATVYQERGVPFLRSQNIHFDGLRMQDVAKISPKLHLELKGSHVKPGDVLLNITGASIGRVCPVPDSFVEGNVNQHVCIIRPNRSSLLPNLLAAYLSTPMLQREIQSEQSGASREGLTLQSIRNFKVVLPPLAEQEAIVEYLDKATANIDDATARARRQIELLQEYRTRLIADVVTGKLDVREAVSQLPKHTMTESG